MRVSFAPAFLKQLEKLDPGVKEDVKAAAAKIIDFYTEGKRTPGLGIKRLRREIWEARAGLRVRVLYLLADQELRFILAGSHDDVKRRLSKM